MNYRKKEMIIDVTKIRDGFPGISPVTAAHLYESFMVCMNYHAHAETVHLPVEGQTNQPISPSSCLQASSERPFIVVPSDPS